MELGLIDVRSCNSGQVNDIWIGGGNSTYCQVFFGNAGYYTQVCYVPRRLESVTVPYIQARYCRDMMVPPYLHVLTSPSFPIAIVATIILYFFLRYIIRLAEGSKVNLREQPYAPPSKKDLRFPPSSM